MKYLWNFCEIFVKFAKILQKFRKNFAENHVKSLLYRIYSLSVPSHSFPQRSCFSFVEYRIRVIAAPGFYFSIWVFGWGLIQKIPQKVDFLSKKWGCIQEKPQKLDFSHYLGLNSRVGLQWRGYGNRCIFWRNTQKWRMIAYFVLLCSIVNLRLQKHLKSKSSS